jgi:putative ABC transport system permease protein
MTDGMNISEVFKLALKAIISNKLRAFLTMLGIIIGVSCVILLVAVGQGLQLYITQQFESLGANTVAVLPGTVSLENGLSGSQPNFAGSKLTLKMADDIDRIGGPIEAAGGASQIPSTIQYKGKSKYTTVAGITANYSDIRNLTVGSGRNISETDVDSARNVAVIGDGIRETLFGQSDSVGKDITIADNKFTVIGILENTGSGGLGLDINSFVAIPITAAQRLNGSTTIQAMNIKAKSKEDIPAAIDLAKRYMSKQLKKDEYSVLDQASLVSSINSILGIVTAALGGIAAISLVVGGIGIMNIMLVSVTERTKEIGLRKAIGAKPSDILMQFLIEAVVLSLVGGGIGIALGYGGSLLIQQAFPAQVTPWSVALAFGVSSAVGIIFGVAPAIRASRLQPIEALRYE